MHDGLSSNAISHYVKVSRIVLGIGLINPIDCYDFGFKIMLKAMLTMSSDLQHELVCQNYWLKCCQLVTRYLGAAVPTYQVS